MNQMTSQSQSSEFSLIQPQSELAEKLRKLASEGIDLETPPEQPSPDTFWRTLCDVETELWIDSGDLDQIDSLWNETFAGVTTNNTLLNKEVQKETYDDLMPRASELLGELDPETRVREIGFLLNLRHALRLVQRFRCRVSVELHTDLANDVEATLVYARRCHQVCPEYFVVKIPLTPSGLIAIRKLQSEGIQVNCTLGFSARQNYVATALSSPAYVNVFLGRLNAYVAENGLGDGKLVGEKATIESQQEVGTFTRGLPRTHTRQIAASLRDAEQLPHLAGVDVITMPPQVAQQARETLSRPWHSRLNDDYQVSLSDSVDADSIRIEKLWSVSKRERNLVQKLILNPPSSAEELSEVARDNEVVDLFPELSPEDQKAIAEDGKIAKHDRWQDRIADGELAIDSLMTFAGLASFTAAQSALDDRIRRQIT